MEALKYQGYPEIKEEKDSCPVIFKYKDKVVAFSNDRYAAKRYVGYVVGYWYDARNVENFYAVKIVGKAAKNLAYPVAIFPQSRMAVYKKKGKKQ